VRAGRFRSDLFYRLNVFPIKVPPLRERRSDVPQLVMFFLDHFSRKVGKRITALSPETAEQLVNYAWPGNVRELQNIIERGVVLSQGPVLTLDLDLTHAVGSASGSGASERVASPEIQRAGGKGQSAIEAALSEPLSLEEVERRHILSVLQQTGGMIEGSKGAARILDLHPNTLRSRMKKLGIKRSAHELS